VTYRILILRQAQKELAALPQSAYEQIKRAVLRLATEPRPRQSRKLVSRVGGVFVSVIIA